jgi:DNA polymerase mu
MPKAISHFRQMKKSVPSKSSEPPTKRRKMSNDNSSSESEHLSPSPSPVSTSGVVKLYIVQAKLNAQDISQLFSLAETHNLRVSKSRNAVIPETKLELCATAEEADIIISNVHMRKRLERHIDWDLAVCHHCACTVLIG